MSVHQFIAAYLVANSEEVGGKRHSIYSRCLQMAADNALLLGIKHPDLPNVELGTQDYIRWSNVLKCQYGWGERTPHGLWRLIESARKEWAMSKRQESSDLGSKSQPVERPMTESNGSVRESFSEIHVEDVSMEQNPSSLLLDGQRIYRKCSFCTKECLVLPRTGKIISRLIGTENDFYCPLCVRQCLHTRRRRNVLILTFRGIIGYIYKAGYFGRRPRLYVSQIQDLIDLHVQIGYQNPLFLYDPETFCWFVDFERVGNSKKKIPIDEVYLTVNELISAFNPYSYIKDFKSWKIVERYEEAINDFYEQRFRPEGKRILAPTLKQVGADTRDGTVQKQDKKLNFDEHRNFLPADLLLHARRF